MAEAHFAEAKKLRGHVKHDVLKGYLDGWVPIMLNKYGTAVYVDGFAGAGRHENGDEGSPIKILKAIKTHKGTVKREDPKVILIFIEKDPKKHSKLQEVVTDEDRAITSDNNFTIELEFILGDFNDKMHDILEKFSEKPMIVFADPFGFTCKMATCHAILATHHQSAPKELFINLMDSYVRRFERNHHLRASHDDLMGCSDWREKCEGKSPEEKSIAFYQEYIAQLQKGYHESPAKIERKKILPLKFAMRSENNRHIYHLVYVTTHLKGIGVMKRAMKNESQTWQTFIFSEWLAEKNLVRDIVREKGHKVQAMVNRIVDHFGQPQFQNTVVSGATIGDFILLETPYPDNEKIELKKELKKFIKTGHSQFVNIVFDFRQSKKDEPASQSGSSHNGSNGADHALGSQNPIDHVYTTAVMDIKVEFAGKKVNGEVIESYCVEHKSKKIRDWKTKLKPFLKPYRCDDLRTREFHKMTYNFPPALPKASAASGPSRKASVAAGPSRKASAAARPSRNASAAAKPGRKASAAARPSRNASAAARPSRKASAAARPSRKKKVAKITPQKNTILGYLVKNDSVQPKEDEGPSTSKEASRRCLEFEGP